MDAAESTTRIPGFSISIVAATRETGRLPAAAVAGFVPVAGGTPGPAPHAVINNTADTHTATRTRHNPLIRSPGGRSSTSV